MPIWCEGRENGRWLGFSHCLDKREHPRHQVDPPPEPEAAGWVMPPELEPFRERIAGTGGNTVERLMGIYLDGEKRRQARFANEPLYLCAMSVGAQVDLLRALAARGELAPAVLPEP